MRQLSKGIKRILVFTLAITGLSIAYYLYVLFSYPAVEENETFLSEIGEFFGEIGLWLLLFIYSRTVIKLLLGTGPISKRILPEYSSIIDPRAFDKIIYLLDRTHIYFGISAVAVIILHIVLVGMPMQILFFPAVLILVIWQGVFGMFISWQRMPKQSKKISYLVHAQLFTGIMIGSLILDIY